MFRRVLSVFLLSGTSHNVFASDFYLYGNAIQNSYGLGNPPSGGIYYTLNSYRYNLIKDESTSFGVGGGYRINNKFSLEVGYSDLGQSIVRETISSSGINELTTSKITSNWAQIQTSVLANFPISNSFSFYGRLGLTKITEESRTEREQETYNSDSKTSRNCALISLGSNFELTEKIKLRLEYTYFNVGSAYHPRTNISAGFVYWL
jgi:opacity protein-like surface antigen